MLVCSFPGTLMPSSLLIGCGLGSGSIGLAVKLLISGVAAVSPTAGLPTLLTVDLLCNGTATCQSTAAFFALGAGSKALLLVNVDLLCGVVRASLPCLAFF